MTDSPPKVNSRPPLNFSAPKALRDRAEAAATKENRSLHNWMATHLLVSASRAPVAIPDLDGEGPTVTLAIRDAKLHSAVTALRKSSGASLRVIMTWLLTDALK